MSQPAKHVPVHPRVSIVTISYNQEKYIEEALESFVMQRTSFPFEVVVCDDASTDKTPEIIAKYAKKYPDIIKPVLRKENIGAQPNFMDCMKRAKGDYIALCEGDDFWTSPHKLQMQADFLSEHPDYSIVFHPVRVFFENGEEEEAVFPLKRDTAEFTLTKLLEGNYMQTNSVMYRRRTYDGVPTDILPLDWYLHLYHAKYGKIGFINEVMSAYRRHSGGLWWESRHNSDTIWIKHGLAHYSMYCEIFRLFSDDAERRDIVRAAIYRTFGILAEMDRKYKKNLVDKAYKKYPESVDPLVVSLAQSVKNLEKANYEKQDRIDELNERVRQQEDVIGLKEKEIRAIRASKLWRALEKYRKTKRKFLRR